MCISSHCSSIRSIKHLLFRRDVFLLDFCQPWKHVSISCSVREDFDGLTVEITMQTSLSLLYCRTKSVHFSPIFTAFYPCRRWVECDSVLFLLLIYSYIMHPSSSAFGWVSHNKKNRTSSRMSPALVNQMAENIHIIPGRRSGEHPGGIVVWRSWITRNEYCRYM